jgi:cellulose synthase/poly-beta-1,6-N-acetylglucosamine synthase-like glycosyltransferase
MASPFPADRAARPQSASRREATANRMVRWRIRLLLFSLGEIAIAQLLVLTFLPLDARLFSAELVCMTFVFLGATPVFASLAQYALIGFHGLRTKYRRMAPYYPRCAVVVPAWNEGAVIGVTIEHLLDMEYPPERLRVIVVDDASTDETPDVVQAKVAAHPGQVVHLRRAVGGQGKAHTLNHGIAHLLADDWAEAVLIIDADVLFERDALRKMTRHLSDPDVGAVTAYIKEGTRDGNYLTRFIAYEYITAQAAARRAQNVLGVLACLAGGAQLHSRENLEAIGGRIDTSSLAEDTVTTFKTQIDGRRVEFEGNAVVWAEEPSTLDGLWKQRLRWGRGNVQISLQYLSIWGRQRSAFGRLGRLPFLLIWFTVLLMPVLMFGASAGLITLYVLRAPVAWSAFHALWIWHAIAYLFGTLMCFAIDWKTARRCWFEAFLFPGLVSLAIMVYSVYPRFYEVDLALWLAHAGFVLTPRNRELLTLFMYAWLVLCIPLAYLAKLWSKTPGYKWLAPLTIYLVGYGPFLCAVTFGSYVKELLNVSAAWDKTVKTGRVIAGAALRP